jgi:Spy/CpxP family protein refolding chaperone
MATKSRWSMLTILVVLTAGLLLAGQTYPAPQTSAPPQGSAMGSHPDASSPEARLQMLSEKLNLTADQQAKLKPILEDQAQQMKTVRDDTSLSQEQKKAKMKAIHESFHGQINGVLTPEQQAKLKQMKHESMEKHKEMKEDHQ